MLKDDALAAIREHLLGDDCTHPLSERSLAARLGIGLGSVRSALERLRAAGLVVATPNSGLRVPEVTSQEIIDFYEMRLVLECHIAAALAGRLTSEQSDQLDAILIEQEQTACARDTGRYHQLDLEFHAALVGFHRNAAMVRALDQLRDRMYQLSRRLHGAHPERLAVNAAQHRTIVNALRDGNPDEARQRMQTHLLWGRQFTIDPGGRLAIPAARNEGEKDA
ncbi:GntR family transcriptional regulator [Lichenicoccus roseus]|uniref:GntR family transcriptional regulator n=1 Tax=Lichenicoccus roseus TaxID=2683649 RepID=UPI001486FA69|nr:GntR family transcriptional regulator [Lichenicoccus roseus]